MRSHRVVTACRLTSLDLSGNVLGGSLADAAALWEVVSASLLQLDVSRVGLRSLAGLDRLGKLESLVAAGNLVTKLRRGPPMLQLVDVSGNALRDPEDLADFVRNLKRLRSIKISGNPLPSDSARLVVFSNPSVAFVDGTPTTSAMRHKAARIFDPNRPRDDERERPDDEGDRERQEEALALLEERNTALEEVLDKVAQSHADRSFVDETSQSFATKIVTRREFVPVPVEILPPSPVRKNGREEVFQVYDFEAVANATARLTKCREQCMLLVGALAELDAKLGDDDDSGGSVVEEGLLNELRRLLDEDGQSLLPSRFVREDEGEYRRRVAERVGAAAILEKRLCKELRVAQANLSQPLVLAAADEEAVTEKKEEQENLSLVIREENDDATPSKTAKADKPEGDEMIPSPAPPPPAPLTPPPKSLPLPPSDAECDFVLNDALTGPREALLKESENGLRMRRQRLASRQDMPGARLEVQIVSARDLPPMKYSRQTADAYVVVSVGSCRRKTHVVQNSRYPDWRVSVALPAALDATVLFSVMDKTRVGEDDLIGRAQVDCSKLADQRLKQRWLHLSKPTTATGSVAARTRLSARTAIRVQLRLIHDRKALIAKAIRVIDDILLEREKGAS